jgi:hypothetical protein
MTKTFVALILNGFGLMWRFGSGALREGEIDA